MLVIYHSRGAVAAGLAAAVHMGWVHPDPPGGDKELQEVFTLLEGRGCTSAEGLWRLGQDARGRQVFAFGRASRPDVVYRAFHGLADIFGVAKDSFCLQNVGPAVAWADLKVKALRLAGLGRLAHALELRLFREGWQDACTAVRRAAVHLAVMEQGPA